MKLSPLVIRPQVCPEEAKMIEVKRTQETKPDSNSIGMPLSSALIREAELWMGAHSDFLTNAEIMLTDWHRRQREAFDVSSRSVRKIYNSRNIIDLAQAQNEWVSDCLEWTASEIRAIANDAATMTRKAAQRLGEAARERGSVPRQQNQGSAQTAADTPMERAAAE
jgi:hypothetical protein